MAARMQRFVLPALVDGFPIAAQYFEPNDTKTIVAATLISCATGIKARFYQEFALWLAAQGIAVLTYDYRYNGQSWPDHLLHLVTGPKATKETRLEAIRSAPEDLRISTHWATRDTTAAIRYAANRWPAVPLTLVGHSMGGMIFPYNQPEEHLVSRYLNVAGGPIWLGDVSDPLGHHSVIMQQIRRYIETDKVFYASRLGLGGDLPVGVGVHWMEYLIHVRGPQEDAEVAKATKAISKPYLAIGFQDDWVCNRPSLDNNMALLSNASGLNSSLWIDPSIQNPPWPECGHIMSFAPGSSPGSTVTREDTVWPVFRDWILNGTVLTTAGEYKVWTSDDEYDPWERSRYVYKWDENSPVQERVSLSSNVRIAGRL
ncbi:alpha/beta-hydrolase [Clavulina sp. PMI_390]|nr:alpha/beta-hydrolase [Clavulina sp. PMI_390]